MSISEYGKKHFLDELTGKPSPASMGQTNLFYLGNFRPL
jgi:hypothetical protein